MTPFLEHLREVFFSLKFCCLIKNITNSISSNRINCQDANFLLKSKTEIEAIVKFLLKIQEKSEKAKSLIEKQENFLLILNTYNENKNLGIQENNSEVLINEICKFRSNFQLLFKLPQHSKFYFLNGDLIKNVKLNVNSNISNNNTRQNDIQITLERRLHNKSLIDETDDY